MKRLIGEIPCDYIFHLGDHGDDLKDAKLYAVRGNCDGYSTLPLEIILPIEQCRVLLVHGHRQGVKQNLHVLRTYAAQKQADVVCFGHTHQGLIQQEGDCLFLNPGSISLPRSGNLPSYMIVTIEGRNVQARLVSL